MLRDSNHLSVEAVESLVPSLKKFVSQNIDPESKLYNAYSFQFKSLRGLYEGLESISKDLGRAMQEVPNVPKDFWPTIHNLVGEYLIENQLLIDDLLQYYDQQMEL